MIDPVTIGVAYKAATSAIDLIKKGINMHKDATEIGDHLLQYFEKRDEAQRLKKELQKQNKRKQHTSIESQAIEEATYEHNLRKKERELKEQLYWSGHADLWQTIQKKKIQIKREREREEELRKAQIPRYKDMILYSSILVTLLGFTGWIIYELIIAINKK